MQLRTERQLNIRPLILKRITTIQTYQSAFGIHTIECTLRTVQHVNALDLISVKIKSTLIQNGHTVDVYSHRWCRHTRTNSSHIYRRGVTTSIHWHRKRWHIHRQMAHILNIQASKHVAIKGGTTHRLLAKTKILLWLINNHYLFNIIDS